MTDKWIIGLYKARDEVKEHIEKLDIQKNIHLFSSFARLDGYIQSLELTHKIGQTK